MLDWLIIGGGVHGALAARFLLAAGAPVGGLRILDPHPAPLDRFFARCEATGMGSLRSGCVHHLDVASRSLLDFAAAAGRLGELYGQFQRPSLKLFRDHCRQALRPLSKPGTAIRGTARRIERRPRGFGVTGDPGVIEARRIVLAPGDQVLAWPQWARRARAALPVQHVLEPGFTPPSSGAVAVVGGGISAAQVATAALHRGVERLVLIARHRERLHEFDTDSVWLGRRQRRFAAIRSVSARRSLIDEARHKGSMPLRLAARLVALERQARLSRLQGEVVRCAPAAGGLALELSTGAEVLVDEVVLATGFAAARPGGALVDRAVEELALPLSDCGYPVLGGSLEWLPGLHVTGGLAELELGPTARNIHGARRAARRLANQARSV